MAWLNLACCERMFPAEVRTTVVLEVGKEGLRGDDLLRLISLDRQACEQKAQFARASL
eukprot:SAG31_NODE_1099_length_9914_cov_6.721345_9_plen_58_part_00